jgi:AcrR family transcriptional regulator
MEKDSTTVQMPHFITKSKAYNTWIKVGYELFAQEGPEGIQIERLARILDLNKSGFYHYFGNHDSYFQHLMQHHLLQVDLMVEKIQSTQDFMPECIQFLAESSIPILVQKQLQRACHSPLFAKTFTEVNAIVDPVILPLWADFIEITDNPTLAFQYFEFVRDIFYARVTPATLSFEFIFDICMQAKEISNGLKNTYSGVVITKHSA